MTIRSDEVVRRKGAHGIDVGVILLDSDCPRALGDIGNARTFDMPVLYTTAKGASPSLVVEQKAEGLLESFVDETRFLTKRGVRAISTSCGFLALRQPEIAARSDAFIATSALLQVPQLLAMLSPDARLGVITANAQKLTSAHLRGAGISEADEDRLEVVGLENAGHFYSVIVQATGGDLDVDRAQAEVLERAREAVRCAPGLRGFVLECVNLPPYADAIRAETGLPVWDATTMVNWLQAGFSGGA